MCGVQAQVGTGRMLCVWCPSTGRYWQDAVCVVFKHRQVLAGCCVCGVQAQVGTGRMLQPSTEPVVANSSMLPDYLVEA